LRPFFGLLLGLVPAIVQAANVTVIAHRGASGYRPEHTIASYTLGIEQGADYIEPDLVLTKDGVLVARHENEIGGTTDVAAHPEFASRRTTKTIDGEKIQGWFTEDFTLAELKTLRARERIPKIRPQNTKFDGRFEVPTFDEVLALARQHNVGVYPETKHPTYFDNLGLTHDEPLLASIQRSGVTRVFIQSFEIDNLKRLRRKTSLPLVQLIDVSRADLTTPAALAGIAKYAQAIGPNKSLVIPRNADGTLGSPSTLISDAHKVGLAVHPWTFRAEKEFVPVGVDVAAELSTFLGAGVDGFFTDHPDLGRKAVSEQNARKQ
jgi:glycerophosphoryl diester phosphodiesterase